jgi:O-acetyl-ADP-ribose deacetylase (regulator of RNase III)
MPVKVILVDVNPKMVKAWRATFEENPEVDIVEGSMLAQNATAWVSPTNSRGSMDGGLDAIIKNYLGVHIEKRLQQEIVRVYGQLLPVGHATCVPTGLAMPRFLISTPTMVASNQDISDTMNVALACAAAFQAVHMQNARDPDSITSVVLPGLGANTGKVPVEICADLMWTGYDLFRKQQFTDFHAMRLALEEQLGDLGPTSGAIPVKKSFPLGHLPGAGPTAAPPSHKKMDIDFDDSDFDDAEE